MSDLNRKVNVELEFNADTKAAQRNVDALDKKLEEVKKTTNELEERFGKLTQASGALAALGASVWVPAIAAANKYSQAVGNSEKVSRQYVAAQKRQEQATIEFGRKSAEALQPYYDILTNILEEVADVDPSILRGGIAIGGALAVLGSIGVLVGAIGQFSAQATLLVTTLNAKAGGNVAGVGIAGALGVGAGIAATRGIGRATGNEDAADANAGDLIKFAGQATVLALLGVATGLKEAAESISVIVAFLESVALGAEMTRVKVKSKLDLFVLGLETGVEDLIDALKLSVLALKKAALEIGIDTPFGDINLGEELGFDKNQIDSEIAAITSRLGDYEQRRQRVLDDESEALQGIEDAASEIVDRHNQRMRDIDEAFDIEAITDAILNAFQMGGDSVEEDKDEEARINAEAYAQGIDALEQYNADIEAIDKNYYDNAKRQEADFNEELLDMQEDFDEKRVRQLEDFNEKADKEAADFAKSQAQEAERYNKELQQQARDFHRESAALETEFRRTQKESQQRFEAEEIQRVKDFAVKEERAREDSRERQLQLISRLDFAGLFEERRNRSTQKKRDKEDFDKETQARQQNYETQRRDAQAAFIRQQAERRQQYEQEVQDSRAQFADEQRRRADEFRARQADARQQFNRQRQQEQDAFRQQMADRQQAYQAQINQERTAYNILRAERKRAFDDQIAQAFGYGKYELAARAAYYDALRKQLDAFLGTQQGSPNYKPRNAGSRTIPEFAEGGYKQGDGLAYLHNKERVLKPSLTSAMENAMGGRLTDERIMNYITNNNRSSAPVVNINGSGLNEQQLERVARRALISALEEAGASS